VVRVVALVGVRVVALAVVRVVVLAAAVVALAQALHHLGRVVDPVVAGLLMQVLVVLTAKLVPHLELEQVLVILLDSPKALVD
jgi:hypothetical protein